MFVDDDPVVVNPLTHDSAIGVVDQSHDNWSFATTMTIPDDTIPQGAVEDDFCVLPMEERFLSNLAIVGHKLQVEIVLSGVLGQDFPVRTNGIPPRLDW